MPKTKKEKAAAVKAWKLANPERNKEHSRRYYEKTRAHQIQRSRNYKQKRKQQALSSATSPRFEVPANHFTG